MKKRIFSLFLALLMLLAVAVTGCSDEKTDDEKRRENASAGDTAFTLSIWLPTNSNHEDVKFLERLEAVEEAINAIIATDNTKIEIVPVSDELYEQKLAEKLNQAQKSPLVKPVVAGKDYKNDAIPEYPDEENKEDYFYKLKFPEVLENQIDICLIRDYGTYLDFANKGYLYSLNSYITSESASYPRFKKIIKNELISSLVVNKNLYAVPNNRAYASDEYKFILINKDLVNKTGLEFDADSIKTILDCEEIINAIGSLNLTGVVPFVGTTNDAPGLIHWGADSNNSIIVSTNDKTAPTTVLNSEEYLNYTMLYKKLAESNFVKNNLADGEKAGVSFLTGTLASADAYANDYYIIKTETPVLKENDVFGSMFAITDYSIDYDRAMTILYALNTNSQIRTLLQYGIQDVDYVLEYADDKSEPTIKLVRDENGNIIYDMNNDYTGNGYITYREEGTTFDDWNYVKSVNYDSKISKYLHFMTNYKKATTEEQRTADALLAAPMAQIANDFYSLINAMSVAEFQEFIDMIEMSKTVDFKSLEKKITDGKEEYDTLKAKTEELTDAEKTKIENYEKLLEQKATYDASIAFKSIYGSEDIANILSKYQGFEKSYNK